MAAADPASRNRNQGLPTPSETGRYLFSMLHGVALTFYLRDCLCAHAKPTGTMTQEDPFPPLSST